jgi:hypothetical protein
MYMGFGVTFLTIWGLTLPIITSCITIITAFIQIKNKERISILEKLCAFFGVIIDAFLLSYTYMYVSKEPC